MYINIWDYINSYKDLLLYIFIGGRGIGKTYSALSGVLETGSEFMYVRRTESELDNCCTIVNNPFLTINRDFNRHIGLARVKDFYTIIEEDTELGVAGALSTFGKFRGSDFSHIDYIIFDEFINTSATHSFLKGEAGLFFNLIETVQRNREIDGGKSVKVILMSNSNTLDSDILKALKLCDIIRALKQGVMQEYADCRRGLYIKLLESKELMEKKKKTKLYQLTENTEFYSMAINNDFVHDDFTLVRKIESKNLIPICSYCNIFFYNIKNSDKIFCTYRKHEVNHYDKKTIKQFKREYGLLLNYYLEANQLLYYSYDIAIELKSIFKWKS